MVVRATVQPQALLKTFLKCSCWWTICLTVDQILGCWRAQASHLCSTHLIAGLAGSVLRSWLAFYWRSLALSMSDALFALSKWAEKKTCRLILDWCSRLLKSLSQSPHSNVCQHGQMSRTHCLQIPSNRFVWARRGTPLRSEFATVGLSSISLNQQVFVISCTTLPCHPWSKPYCRWLRVQILATKVMGHGSIV